jgi:rod shape-determining protein MreB
VGSAFRPEVMAAVPGITSTERRAVVDATIAAGAKATAYIKEPIVVRHWRQYSDWFGFYVTIIGHWRWYSGDRRNFFGRNCRFHFGKNRRLKIDLAITEHIRKKYGLAIGERTSEQIKINIGSACI